jgi:nicotinamide mononucleotide adenylyltransferase
MSSKYALFIGRWQNLHDGHDWLFSQKIKENVPVLIAIRDVDNDENNPKTAQQVKQLLDIRYQDLISIGKVRIIIIPDIVGVYYGRDVGYEVKEFVPPQNIAEISGTKIRQALKEKMTNI